MKICYVIVKKYCGMKGNNKDKLIMKTEVDKFVKELEDMYENSCFKKAIKEGNGKCLALDEQELAIMHMCIEALVNEEGVDKNNYLSKGLFILLKNHNLGYSECTDDRVKEEPLKYKKFEESDEYMLDKMTQLLLVYYAVLLLYANDKNTGDYNEKSKRRYFKVYAYFACICPKTFCVLFFNQLHLFMSKANKNLSSNELREYLEYTEELWREYISLLQNERRIEITGEVISQFSKIMAYNENVLYENLIQIEDLCDNRFLAFDFMGGDTLGVYRFEIVIEGIHYFWWYLEYLKDEIKKRYSEESLLSTVEKVQDNAEDLTDVFSNFLEKNGTQYSKFKRKFDNIHGLLKRFHKEFEDTFSFVD